jgi:hypothetical protein
MQTYQGRGDETAIADVLIDIVGNSKNIIGQSNRQSVIRELKHISTEDTGQAGSHLQQLLPRLRRAYDKLGHHKQNLFIFLDDFHLLRRDLQPRMLSRIYAFTRGNNIFVKLSAIESLSQTWDAQKKEGFQIPHDAQTIKLDLNLTAPDKATDHIGSILDAHAVYCGLPSVRSLFTSKEVLHRLVWVSAGVPRDALDIFSQAMTKAAGARRKFVSVTNVNIAASEAVNQKLRDLEQDAVGTGSKDKADLFEKIRDFCLRQKRQNAFLVEIQSDDYPGILELVDLRLLHVLSEGITPHEAGRKYMALILDYGFYTGIRAARSVQLFNVGADRVSYQALRKLPIFSSTG